MPAGEGAARALVVRAAGVADAAEIARVQVASWRRAYRGQLPDAVLDALDEAERADRWRTWLRPAEMAAMVGLRDGLVVGFSSLVPSRDAAVPDTGEVMALYVHPNHWATGVGAALLRASLESARQRGYRALILWVLASNMRARGFYERMGMVADGESKQVNKRGHVLLELRYRLNL